MQNNITKSFQNYDLCLAYKIEQIISFYGNIEARQKEKPVKVDTLLRQIVKPFKKFQKPRNQKINIILQPEVETMYFATDFFVFSEILHAILRCAFENGHDDKKITIHCRKTLKNYILDTHVVQDSIDEIEANTFDALKPLIYHNINTTYNACMYLAFKLTKLLNGTFQIYQLEKSYVAYQVTIPILEET